MSFGTGSPGISGASTGAMPPAAMAPTGPNVPCAAQHQPENTEGNWMGVHPGYPQPMRPNGTPELPFANPGKGR